MTFSLIYELDHQRVMAAVINDARNTIPAVAGQNGNIIYAYIHDQTALVVPGVLCYRIVAPNGVISGYILLKIDNIGVSQLSVQLRPAFNQFSDQMSLVISTFIINGTYWQDYLY